MKFIFQLIIFQLILINPVFSQSESEYIKSRIKMVKNQIERRGITDKKVLESMKSVPRHLFVPKNLQKNAYEDRPLPIGYGQTISQPYIVALMTELLKLDYDKKVLEIGTGSGYQAAILSKIVREVYTIEIYKELSKRAKSKFKSLNYNNILTLNADGYYGWEQHAPFDAIIVTCAPSFVPPPLIQQLKVGGLMVIPVGPPFTVQKLLLLQKVSNKNVITEEICSVSFVPFIRDVK